MPPRNRPPSYRHYKPKDLAVVRLHGKDHYLGKYNSPESWREYYRLIAAEFLPPSERLNVVAEVTTSAPEPISIKKLCLLYIEFAESEYVRDGKITNEVLCIRYALRRVLKLFADILAVDFTPKALKQVRDELVRDGQGRKTVNCNIGRIKRMFRWGVENELLPVTTYQALATVTGLKRGRTAAPEPRKISPVTDVEIEAVMPWLPLAVRTMVQLQQLSGCRPGEICLLRPCDVDCSGEVWCYRPHSHKTERHNLDRRIYFGPKGQEILRPWLDRPAEQYCFSPIESEQVRRKVQHMARKTPLNAGNRPGTNRKARPQRPPGERYTTTSYRRAIERACDSAKIAPWKPNQLRHQRATELTRLLDLDAARIVLGHTDPRVTEHYAEKDFAKAAAYMQQFG